MSHQGEKGMSTKTWGWGKPDKGKERGKDSKGRGKEGKGKGPSIGFQGVCYYCDQWGHSLRFCKHKDQEMEAWRRSQQRMNRVEETSSSMKREGQEENTADRFHLLCGVSTWRSIPLVKTSWEEEVSDEKQLNAVMWNDRPFPVARRENKLKLTLDSGAAESVIPSQVAPHIEVVKPACPERNTNYVMANGEVARNRGEKHIPVQTAEGEQCLVRVQVTDVTKTLMSVGKICDAGHRVVFDKGGGYIENTNNRKRTRFERNKQNGLYVLEVSFQRQGI